MDYFGGAKRAPSAYNSFVRDFALKAKAAGQTFSMQAAAAAWKATNPVNKAKAASACRGVNMAGCKTTTVNGRNCSWVTPKRIAKKTGVAVKAHCRLSPARGPSGPRGPLRPDVL